jgi:hypothetical protein
MCPFLEVVQRLVNCIDEKGRWKEATAHALLGVDKFPRQPEFRFHLGNLFGKQVSHRSLVDVQVSCLLLLIRKKISINLSKGGVARDLVGLGFFFSRVYTVLCRE